MVGGSLPNVELRQKFPRSFPRGRDADLFKLYSECTVREELIESSQFCKKGDTVTRDIE